MVWILEQIPRFIDNIVKYKKNPKIVKPIKIEGIGVGAVEAPRGTLFHDYRIKEGFISEANFVIPTAQNLEDCEKYMREATEVLLSQDAEDETIRGQCEVIARAYDPCISCSTHLVSIESEIYQ